MKCSTSCWFWLLNWNVRVTSDWFSEHSNNLCSQTASTVTGSQPSSAFVGCGGTENVKNVSATHKSAATVWRHHLDGTRSLRNVSNPLLNFCPFHIKYNVHFVVGLLNKQGKRWFYNMTSDVIFNSNKWKIHPHCNKIQNTFKRVQRTGTQIAGAIFLWAASSYCKKLWKLFFIHQNVVERLPKRIVTLSQKNIFPAQMF